MRITHFKWGGAGMLLDKLKKYSESGALPMHMPGHKRNTDAFPWLAELGGGIDITEIDGFDDLNDPQELFFELERRVSRLWGSKESICLVNGSTSGVLAAVRAALERGGELLLFRGSHRSVYHASEIVGCVTHYLTPRIESDFGVWGSITADEVEAALAAHPAVRLVAITSPTYEGVISDVRAIADVCHAHGVPFFVDEAHGAHLGFGDFPESAVHSGADLVVASLHKTLPSLTQTAVLHINGDIVDAKDVRRNAAMFQSSSPSYLLSASIDGCVDYLEREGDVAADRWLSAVRKFDESVHDLENLRILRGGENIFAFDPSKIVISAAGTDIDGAGLMAIFREKFNIELEMAYGDYVVAMTGMGDTAATLMRLADAVHAIDSMCRKIGKSTAVHAFSLPERRMNIRDAVTAAGEFFDLAAAVGRVSGEYVWVYPPGAPILAPGEVIDENIARAIGTCAKLHSTRGCAPDKIFCVGEY